VAGLNHSAWIIIFAMIAGMRIMPKKWKERNRSILTGRMSRLSALQRHVAVLFLIIAAHVAIVMDVLFERWKK